MLTVDTSGKQINFTPKGLNLLKMGSKISDEIKSDLVNIDTSTIQGLTDYSSINSPYYAQENYVYKKLISKNYVFNGIEDLPFDLLIAMSLTGEIKAIQIKFKTRNYSTFKDMLNKVYGKHDTEVSTEYSMELNDVSYQSLYWSYSEFEIRFSDSEIRIFYPTSKEYIEKLLKQ